VPSYFLKLICHRPLASDFLQLHFLTLKSDKLTKFTMGIAAEADHPLERRKQTLQGP